MTTDPYTTAGTFTWTAPAGVTSVDVECVGGGGGGRGGVSLSRGGGGGRGGDYSFKTVTVVPGTGYTVVVGAAGGGSAYNSNTGLTSGSPSSFNTTSVVAAGGAAAANGFGGTTANGTSVGTTINTGTSGGTSTNASGSAGGDGGAGGTPLGGAGGVGGTTGNIVGGDGTAPGGGGGGGRGNIAGAAGGNGAAGQVLITYTPPGVSSDATAAESVTVTPAGLVGKIATAAVAVSVAITAAGLIGTSNTASQTAAVGITAAGTAASAGFSGAATRSVAVGITAAGLVGETATATRSSTVTITATGTVASITTTTYSTAGTFSWTAPAGVTAVAVELVGGGGGGGSGVSAARAGAGGSGGAYASKTVTVVPGSNYSVVVGAAGGGSTSAAAGDHGGISSFNSTDVVAGAGVGGLSASTATTSGHFGTPVGTVTTDGGNGGGAVGPTAGDGGAGAAPLGGAGGAHTTGAGNPGTAPGGAGAGGAQAGDSNGGDGAPGVAVLTYTSSFPGSSATRAETVTITAAGTKAGSTTSARSVAVGITATGSVAGAYSATATRSVGVTVTAAGTVTASASATAITNVGVTINSAGVVAAAPLPTIGKATLRPPGKLLVRATAPGSTRPAYLNRHGIVAGLSYRQGLPGGPLDASMTLDVLANANVPELAVGSTVEITRGAGVVWAGRVNTLTKGTPWQIQCSGIGGIATTETALTQGNIDDIVDASIADGLPWTRPATLGSYQWYESSSDGPITTKLDQVLSSTLTLYGKRWTVDNDGVLTTVDEPDGAPTLLVKVNDPSIPVGLANYATRVTVRYNDGTTGFPVETVINADAEAQFGRVSVAIYAPWGQAHTAPEAHAFGQAFLDRNSPRLTVTGGFTIAHRQITTVTGGVVDLPDVAKVVGQVARLQFAVPLYDAQVGSTSTIDMVVGAATYDDDNATLALEPIDSQDTPVQIMLAGATHELAR